MKSKWKKGLAVTKLSLTLKSYGLDVEKNRLQTLDADITAYWTRTNKQYMFMVKETFTLADTTGGKFKEVVSFCKANNIKLIVITMVDNDELAGFTEDIRSATSLGFKVLRFGQLDQLYKGALKLNCAA